GPRVRSASWLVTVGDGVWCLKWPSCLTVTLESATGTWTVAGSLPATEIFVAAVGVLSVDPSGWMRAVTVWYTPTQSAPVNDPFDPVVGAVAGVVLCGLAHGAGAGAVARPAPGVVVDVAGTAGVGARRVCGPARGQAPPLP